MKMKEFIIEDGVLKHYLGKKRKVYIPDEVRIIGENAFYDNRKIKSVVLGENVTRIQKYAFAGCHSLKEITFSDSVKVIDMMAFFCTDNIKKVNIDSLESWMNITFKSLPSNPLFKDCSIFKYNTGLYLNGELITDLEVPESISVIKPVAFAGYELLNSVKLHNNISSIGTKAFTGCNLKAIYVSDTVSCCDTH